MMTRHASPRKLERSKRETGLSYKFQRLRERLREAIASGELAGKLPGERALARKFDVNAKTLSKALTDLAAEGILERNIGRGTYVKGSGQSARPVAHWLILCNTHETDSALVRELMKLQPDSRPVAGTTELRPSFLAQFNGVVDCAAETPERFRRQMLVRSVPVVLAAEQRPTDSCHSVRFDQALAAFCLARDLLLGGHLRLGAIEARGSTEIVDAMRRAAARYAPDAVVDSGAAEDSAAMVRSGVTAIACEARLAADTMKALSAQGISAPQGVSVAALGTVDGQARCTGYFLDPAQKAAAIQELLCDLHPHRPTTLWLTGQYVDRGTTGALAVKQPSAAAAVDLTPAMGV